MASAIGYVALINQHFSALTSLANIDTLHIYIIFHLLKNYQSPGERQFLLAPIAVYIYK